MYWLRIPSTPSGRFLCHSGLRTNSADCRLILGIILAWRLFYCRTNLSRFAYSVDYDNAECYIKVRCSGRRKLLFYIIFNVVNQTSGHVQFLFDFYELHDVLVVPNLSWFTLPFWENPSIFFILLYQWYLELFDCSSDWNYKCPGESWPCPA